MKRAYRWALLWLLAVAAVPASGATTVFSAHLNRHSLALGEALTLRVEARGIGGSLGALKLAELKRAFHIGSVTIGTAHLNRKGRTLVSQQLVVRLYPLHSGALHIAALKFRGYRTEPLMVVVHSSAPGLPRVRFTAGIVPSVPRVRQTTLLRLTIYDDGDVQWAPIQLPDVGGLYIARISATQRQEIVRGVQQTVHRYVWHVTPLRAGDWTVRFPLLSADSFGTVLRYPGPAVHFHAARVPAYLPVYVPIGPVTLRERSLPAKIPVRRPVNWTLTVTGDGLSAWSIARLLGPIGGNSAVRFYPPSIVREKQTGSPGLRGTWRVTVPFRLLRDGRIVFPSLALAYFDPVSGRVESARLGGPAVLGVDPLHHVLWRGVSALVAFSLLAVLVYRIGAVHRRYRVRRTALARVRRAADAVSLRRALIGFGGRPALPPALTMRRWLSAIECEHGSQPQLERLIRHLEDIQFGPEAFVNDIDVATAKSQAIYLLKRLRPLRNKS